MGQILRHWRSVTAVLFATFLIVGAYLLVRGVGIPPAAEASEEAALLAAIATKDSDGDGLSDWEEALYGTDPRMTDTRGLDMTDGEAVEKGLIVPKAIADISVSASMPASSDENGLPPPAGEGTLTEAFARTFFSNYVAAKQDSGGTELTDEEVATIMSQTVSSFSSAITGAADFKSVDDLTVEGSGPAALAAFAASAEAVFLQYRGDAHKSEIQYLQDAVEKGDAVALPLLAAKAKAYRDTAVGLAALTVPLELAPASAALISTMMRMSEIASDFARVNDDPLAAMLALEQYLSTAERMTGALSTIGSIYASADLALLEGAPGTTFIQEITAVAARVEAVQAP